MSTDLTESAVGRAFALLSWKQIAIGILGLIIPAIVLSGTAVGLYYDLKSTDKQLRSDITGLERIVESNAKARSESIASINTTVSTLLESQSGVKTEMRALQENQANMLRELNSLRDDVRTLLRQGAGK